MKFIDLFAGLGGFHLALSRLGHHCVFASELDSRLQGLYEQNFGMLPQGDIRGIDINSIPQHHILCAGFPCQPFSKAGEQNGVSCPQWGNLFEDYVLGIAKKHQPNFMILENVSNLERHDGGRTWGKMRQMIQNLGYEVDAKVLSPHKFGIPQIRERFFIVANKKGLKRFKWPEETYEPVSINSVLDLKPKDAKTLSPQVLECLYVWQDFLKKSPKDLQLPSFPIWTMEFGATYPYENVTPYSIGNRGLLKYRGVHGVKFLNVKPAERFDYLPSYARTPQEKFPSWKVNFIRQNREFYRNNQKWLDPWLPMILKFPPSFQKLEWNCKGEKKDIWKFVIQFRASGVRVKRPATAPSLVAMTSTQVPIIAWEKRYMTPRECSRLQCMDDLKFLPNTITSAYKALGNAVNVELIKMIAKSLIGLARGRKKEKSSLVEKAA